MTWIVGRRAHVILSRLDADQHRADMVVISSVFAGRYRDRIGFLVRYEDLDVPEKSVAVEVLTPIRGAERIACPPSCIGNRG